MDAMTRGAGQPTDEELVAAVLAGDRERFGDLVELYQVLDRYDPQYRFSTWLFRVAQNAAIDQIRRRRLKLVSLRQDDTEGENRDWDLPSPERGPYGEMRNRERGVAIQDA